MTRTITTTIEAAGREYEVKGRLYHGTTRASGPDPDEISIAEVRDAATGEIVDDGEFADAVAAHYDEGHLDALDRIYDEIADAAAQQGLRVPTGRP
ncbi:MAG: hypothetical protein ACYTAN_13755 [Planctomycetota bacterium]|jgi:hypothetical protein